MKYLITILGYARTGTNYLCEFLGGTFPTINSNYELFNQKQCFINEKYLDLYLNQNQNQNRKNPILFLNKLMDISEEPIISHKIFPEHLDINIVYKIIDKSNYVLIVKRNFIDVYISYKKAMDMMNKYKYKNPWIKIDTTNYKIDFDIDEYEQQKKCYDDWYTNLLSYITKTNKKYYFIDYVDFHKLSLEEKQNLIKSKLQTIIPSHLLEINKYTETLLKQDKSTDYKTKINNYDEFIHLINNQ